MIEIENYTAEELELHFNSREKMLTKRLAGQKAHALLFAPYHVNPTEYRVLAYLYFKNGESEPSVIADSLVILRQTMTKLVDSLETRGFVCRSTHPTDRRRIFIKLLPAGMEMAKELLSIETEYTKRVEACFSQDALEEYRQMRLRMEDVREAVLQNMLSEQGQNE